MRVRVRMRVRERERERRNTPLDSNLEKNKSGEEGSSSQNPKKPSQLSTNESVRGSSIAEQPEVEQGPIEEAEVPLQLRETVPEKEEVEAEAEEVD